MNAILNGLRMPTINFDAEGAGSGAGAGEGEGSGEGAGASGEGAQGGEAEAAAAAASSEAEAAAAAASEKSPWGEIDDETKEFIGEKSPADIVKELQGAQSLLGKKQIGIPDDKSTPEEWATFHESRGVPKDTEGYDFGAIKDDLLKDVPEDQREGLWDTAEETRFKEFAKASNLSQTEAKNLLQRELQHRFDAGQANVAAESKVSKAAQDMITESWGNRKDEYTQDANNFARHMGLDGDVIAAMQKMAGTSAEARFKLVDHMRQQGAQLREGGKPGTTRPGTIPAGSMTADQARVAKQEYLATSDNKAAYMDANHTNHKMVTEQVTAYLKAERGI